MSSVVAVPGIERLTRGQLRDLRDAAQRLGVDTDWLATIISFESAGTFSPSKLNQSGSGAFGLIQFLPSTAAWVLRLPKEEAVEKGRAMSFSEQLREMVIPYFQSSGRRFENLQDLYYAVFWPAAIGKSGNTVIISDGTKAYTQNRGLDRDGKGYITAGDVSRAITRVYDQASGQIRVAISAPVWPWFLLPVGALAALYLTDRYAPPAYRVGNVPALRPVRSALRSIEKTTEKEVSSWPGKVRTLARSHFSPVRGWSRWASSFSKG